MYPLLQIDRFLKYCTDHRPTHIVELSNKNALTGKFCSENYH